MSDTVVPFPILLSTVILPPCASMIVFTMNSPMPLPPRRHVARSERQKSSKICGNSSGEIPIPRSTTLTLMKSGTSSRYT